MKSLSSRADSSSILAPGHRILSDLRDFPAFSFSRLLILSIAAALLLPHASAQAQVVEIPDPNLESAIRETLELPDSTAITPQEMLRLRELKAAQRGIVDLTGLEFATNVTHLSLGGNKISDLTPLSGLGRLRNLALWANAIGSILNLSPLSNLTELRVLDISGSPISDITPLANLTRLEYLKLHGTSFIEDISPLSNLTQLRFLRLSGNQIVDISPLANLTQLEILDLYRNPIVDLSPLQALSSTEIGYDEICISPDPPIQDRIQNRSLPSLFQGWDNSTVNLSHLSREVRTSYSDLYWHGPPFGLYFRSPPQGYQVTGDLERARVRRNELLAKNPNMLFLSEIRQRDAKANAHYPEDFPYWLRDEGGNLIQDWHESSGRENHGRYLLDFRLPGMQDIIVEQAISISKCGLYDGIFFDWWQENGISLANFHVTPRITYSTIEEERQARLSILQRIRANVPDDFLILCNGTSKKLPISAPYINGSFMETHPDDPERGYTRDEIVKIETNLIWLEANLREPQINCLSGQLISTESFDSPTNKRWMRLFTTISLTLSDGYAVVGKWRHPEGFWYPFWDADLGQPIGPTAQPYQNVPSLYIREFTNGWAVYNRSGKAQTITLPGSATPVSDRGSTAASTTHLLPDLDGEIYLKTKSLADVNRDGKVNILDLVQIANEFGKSTPDPNGDGVVNILDLVFVAQQFSQ